MPNKKQRLQNKANYDALLAKFNKPLSKELQGAIQEVCPSEATQSSRPSGAEENRSNTPKEASWF